jgi:hypothetical protein
VPSYIWLNGGNTFNINTGYGVGNKSIFGIHGFDNKPLSFLRTISFTWENVVGPTGSFYIPPGVPSVLTPYVNVIVDFGGSLRILVMMDDASNPLITNSVGMYSNNGSNILTYSWNNTMNVQIVNSPPNATPGGVVPAVTVGPSWPANAYSFSSLVAANSNALTASNANAELVDDFPADGGLPSGAIVPSILLVSGDSGNLTKSGKKILDFRINGVPVSPF